VLAPGRYLGVISYGIYLWHMPLLLAVLREVPQFGGIRLVLYILIASVVLSSFTWHLMERPALQRAKEATGP
jgi:peptidoglycan/LPS O-acetylase OafA/YrhL